MWHFISPGLGIQPMDVLYMRPPINIVLFFLHQSDPPTLSVLFFSCTSCNLKYRKMKRALLYAEPNKKMKLSALMRHVTEIITLKKCGNI